MKRKRIDWAAVRRARERLDDLAHKHPDLVGPGTGRGADEWEDILEKQEKKAGRGADEWEDILEKQEKKAGRGADEWEDILKKQEKKAETMQTAFRLPKDLLERLDRHVDRVNADTPGLDLNRTDVVRMLLTKGLDEAEREAGRRRK